MLSAMLTCVAFCQIVWWVGFMLCGLRLQWRWPQPVGRARSKGVPLLLWRSIGPMYCVNICR
jgi:hypothetical protein